MKTLILTTLFTLLFFSCDKPVSQPPVPLPDNYRFAYTSPGGVRVFSVVEVPLDSLNAVDEGIRIQIEAYRRFYPNWTKFQSLDKYTVRFIAPQAINMDGSPALIHRAGIQTAGTTYGTGRDGNKPPTIVLPHQANQNWLFRDYLVESARNESEHVTESENNLDLFFRLATGGDCHPHAPRTIGENWCGYFAESDF
jgi:hypothetical protein